MSFPMTFFVLGLLGLLVVLRTERFLGVLANFCLVELFLSSKAGYPLSGSWQRDLGSSDYSTGRSFTGKNGRCKKPLDVRAEQ